jgi:hypothetical protein
MGLQAAMESWNTVQNCWTGFHMKGMVTFRGRGGWVASSYASCSEDHILKYSEEEKKRKD